MLEYEIIATARELVKRRVPWEDKGRSIRGLDCVGLLRFLAEYKFNGDFIKRETPLSTYDLQGYSQYPKGQSLRHALQKACGQELQTINPGNIIATMNGEFLPEHVGIVSTTISAWGGCYGFIHCSAHFGRMVEVRIDDNLKKMICGIYEFPHG